MASDIARQQLLARLISRASSNGPVQREAMCPAEHIEPASFGQRQLWFVEQVQQEQAPYTLHSVQRLPFAVSLEVLDRAINEIIRRHEILRTRFTLEDEAVLQKIAANSGLRVGFTDLESLPEDTREKAAREVVEKAAGQRFDLENGPLLRAELIRLAANEFLLLIAVHHIVFDWQSFQIFFSELDALYAAFIAHQESPLPPVPEQYAVFAREQKDRLTPQRIEVEVAFWKKELADLPLLNFPMDRMRPVLPSFRGGLTAIDIDAELVSALRRLALTAKTTLFTVLLAGLWATLGRLCSQSDFAIGLPMTGRDSDARQQGIGFYVDTLVTRARWSGNPKPLALVESARAALGRSLAHRSLPFEMLVRHLHPARDLGINPLFQIGFQLMHNTMQQVSSQGGDQGRSGAMFDLCVDLWTQDNGIKGRIQYSSDLFDQSTIDLFTTVYDQSLRWILQNDIPLGDWPLDRGHPDAPISMLAGESIPVGEASCLDLIVETARRHPDVIALSDGNTELTYRQLVNRVAQLAAAIAGRNLPTQSMIILAVERSLDLVCLQLALMRCRMVHTCIDPNWPAVRRERISRSAKSAWTIDRQCLRALEDEQRTDIELEYPRGDDLAYVIFTSGSTGDPKGVCVEHAGLVNVAQAQRQMFALGPGRRVAQLASPLFDASLFETMLALCSGATLIVAAPEILAGNALEHFIRKNAIDVLVIPPSLLATVRPETCHSLRLVCVAGETCPLDLAGRYSSRCEFWNLYGPTESTIWATSGREPCMTGVSIGQPIINMRTVVVDQNLNVVPVGMPGELCIAGPGVARGYLDQPELTDERFTSSIKGQAGRFYRSGDLVRQHANGHLVFLGRMDRQLKVRGLRIEPTEIESMLRTHPEVSDAVVDATVVNDQSVLVAYLQSSTSDHNQLIQSCRQVVLDRLPAYMAPNRFVVLNAFTRSSSGKIDMRSLPVPDETVTSGPVAEVAPTTATEHQLIALMKQILQVSRVSPDDDFFSIGGHSLAAAALVARLRTLFGVELTIGDVFSHSQVAMLARQIDALTKIPVNPVDEVPLVRLPRA